MAARIILPFAEQRRFLAGFLRHPGAVGSVVPSSRFLAQAVTEYVPVDARCVAELGPGTGPITRALLRRVDAGATVLALEIDPEFCALLRRSLPDPRLHVIQAPAQELPQQAARHECTLQAVVSGLPFANFAPPLRRDILQAVYAALPPGGVFAGYGYAPFALPAGLREIFGNCRLSFVLRNVPPAFVASAVKR